MTKGKNSRVFANVKCKIQERGKTGFVCGVVHNRNVKLLQIKWDGEEQVREYLPRHVCEIKTSESITEKKAKLNERKVMTKKENREFVDDNDPKIQKPCVEKNVGGGYITGKDGNKIGMKLEFCRLSQTITITPAMKAQISLIQKEIVEIVLSEEDYNAVTLNLNVYNDIYDQIRKRTKLRPLNEFSGDLAVLTARINVRSMMMRALTNLKLRMDEELPFVAFGCPVKPLKMDHVIMKEYPERGAKYVNDSSTVPGGHVTVFVSDDDSDGYNYCQPKFDYFRSNFKRDRGEDHEETKDCSDTTYPAFNKRVKF
jgi:hypothetical protein